MSDYDPNYAFVKNFFLVGVKLILENTKGEILLLQRSDKVPRPYGWDLPGGAVDAAEAPDQAIVRELQEETGIVINNPRLYTSYLSKEHEDDAIILGFFAETDQDEAMLSWEHEAYEWMSREKVAQIDLPPRYRAILEDYLNKKDS